MSISGPNILRGNELDPHLTVQSIRALYAELALMRRIVARIPKGVAPALHGSGPITTVEQIKQELQAGGEHPLRIQSLLGQAAQPQLPFAPWLPADPSLNDPQSQNGSLYVDPANGLKGFDGSTQPGSWKTVPVGTFAAQSANFVFAGPASGTAAAPTFRALVEGDLPKLLDVDTTQVVVNGNVTTDQNMMTFTIPAGALNVIGKLLRITCYGNLDELNGPIVTFKVALVNGATTVVPVNWVPNTPGVTKTNLGWAINAYLVTTATGVTGAVEPHGMVWVNPAVANGTDATAQVDLTTATVGIDLTLAQTLKIQIGFSVASTSNVGRQRMMILEVLN
jgi:hypothetical protein